VFISPVSVQADPFHDSVFAEFEPVYPAENNAAVCVPAVLPAPFALAVFKSASSVKELPL